MKKVFSTYIGHKSIWLYFTILIFFISYFIYLDIIFRYYALFGILVIAPFYEWLLHKYVLHAVNKNESSSKVKYMNRLHRDHHRYPTQVDLLFAPISAGLFIPLQFFIVCYLITQNLNLSLYCAMVSLSYYLFYEWIHLAHHVESYTPKTSWGKKLKTAHLWHHYKNENYWWGVTSSLGDIILRTYPDVKTIKKSITVKEFIPKEFQNNEDV